MNILSSFLFVILSMSTATLLTSPCVAAGNEKIEDIKREVQTIKFNVPNDFPNEEITLLSSWLESFDSFSGSKQHTLELKITTQFEYIKALIEEKNSEQSIERLESAIGKTDKQINDLINTNNDVQLEISKIEGQSD